MGGGQSQERVIGVEESPGDGEPQIIITEDFLRHIKDKQEGGSGSVKPQETEGDDMQFSQTAEQLLMREDYSESSSGGMYYSDEEDSRWKRKFVIEQQKNQNLKALNSEVFDKAVTEIRDKFASKTAGDMMPVCEDCRDRVDDCYQRNKNTPLVCSNLVQDYIECVEKHRKGLLQPPSQKE